MSDEYLYVTKCIFPKLLAEQIASLNQREQFRHCRATSLIKVLSHKDDFGRANISSKAWRNLLGRNYRQIINNLLSLNIIAIQQNDEGKETYSNSPNNRFAKCYYLTDEAHNSGYTVKDFDSAKPHICANNAFAELDTIQLYVKNILINNLVIDYIDYTNEYTNNTTVDMYNNTKPCSVISHMWCKNENDESFNNLIGEIRAHECLKSLAVKDCEVTYGEKGGRLYHNIICMPKIGRKFVWFKNSNVVFDNDIRACFPVLLNKYVHPDEQTFYKSILDGDIYSTIAGQDRRDECKLEFQKYINGNVSNYVKDWFRANLLHTANWIETNTESMASRLQRLESDIMVQRLGKYVLINKIANWIPCHDGWLIDNESANQRIIDYVKDAVESECGYRPKIKTDTRTRQIV